ncbi:MAG: ribonuclease P protein component [Muribaculaceae bacterium]|nr:ribonuclease P protein component [Muribaculaceae bacterium]
MKRFGLYKKQKLCSATAIDLLFGSGGAEFSRIAYPVRAVARRNDRRRSDASLTFLISVPKKRLRHAVDRVLMRRRIREAFRLTHQDYPLPQGLRVDIAFIYVANGLAPYAAVQRSMIRILEDLQKFYAQDCR